MKKFTIKGVLDGFRSSVPQPAKPDQEIVENLRPEHFQVKKVSTRGESSPSHPSSTPCASSTSPSHPRPLYTPPVALIKVDLPITLRRVPAHPSPGLSRKSVETFQGARPRTAAFIISGLQSEIHRGRFSPSPSPSPRRRLTIDCTTQVAQLKILWGQS